MYKRILGILLALVMILSMTTACAPNTQSSTESTTAPTIATTAAITETAGPTTATEEPIADPVETTSPEPELDKVASLNWEIVNNFTLQEISELSTEMVTISHEDLSFTDICEMGSAFHFILMSDFLREDLNEISSQLSSDAYEAFGNIVEQADRKEFSQQYLQYWNSIPSKDILIGCYRTLCDKEISLDCSPILFGYLSESDAIEVATYFLGNPYTKNSPRGIFNCICSCYPEIQEMGIARLIELSKCSDNLPWSIQYLLFHYIEDNSYVNNVLSAEKLDEVRDNVLKNRYFDFVEKYTSFCNSYDDDVAAHAFERLLKIAKSSPDEETTESIRVIADDLWNVDMAQKLHLALDS